MAWYIALFANAIFRAGFPEYPSYAGHVRWRLIPGVC
jgi:hypothetical protein